LKELESPKPLQTGVKKVFLADIPNKPTLIKKISAAKTTRVSRKDYSGNGHWYFPESLGGKYSGFIYVIRDRSTSKGYIGKKHFKGNGKLNKGVESNWQWYTSSCKDLNEAIKEKGKDDFEFIVLEQYISRGALGYAETWTMMKAETPTNRDLWYNLLVNKISWTVKEPITQRHKDRIDMILNGETQIVEVSID
jgi:hypothetical protein